VQRRTDWRAPADGTLSFSVDAGAMPPITGPVELRTGPGGTLDLRGHASNLIMTDGPITVYADSVLLDSDVTLTDLFYPVPEVLPGTDALEHVVVPVSYSCEAGGDPKKAKVFVHSLSNNAADVSVSWQDTLGWLTPDAAIITIEPGDGGFVEFTVNVPETAEECVIDKVTVRATTGEPTPGEYAFEVSAPVDFDVDGTVDRCDGCSEIADPAQAALDLDGVG